MNFTQELLGLSSIGLDEFINNPKSSFDFKMVNYDWSQLMKPSEFKFEVGVTPFSDFGIVLYTWAIYFVFIVGLQMIMKNKEPMKLKYFTAFHNLFLCLGSAGMFLAGALGAWQIVQERGFNDVFCTIDSEKKQGLLYWSLYIYYLSKFPELIDTVVLALKKKSIIFLHWYHHSIVILLTWVWLNEKLSFGVFGLLLNTGIHVFMYYYYFASGLGMNVWYKKYITTGQILQFVSLFALASYYLVLSKTNKCQEWGAFNLSIIVNASFLLLFVSFYRKTYNKKRIASKK